MFELKRTYWAHVVRLFFVTEKLKFHRRTGNVYVMLMDWGELNSPFARSSCRWGDNIE